MCTRRKSAFTLIELLLVIGVISILAAIVIAAVSPQRTLIAAHDAKRSHAAGQLKKALQQYLIDNGSYPGNDSMPSGSGNAVSICRSSINTSSCFDAQLLTPTYLVNIAVDPAETDATISGYSVYTLNGFVQVVSDRSGEPGNGGNPDFITNGLVGYWQLDETSAGTFTDSTGQSSDGTGVGAGGSNNTPQPATDVASIGSTNARSLDFDGTDDYVNLGNSAAITTGLDAGFTLSAWIKAPDSANERRIIDNDYLQNSYFLRLSTTGIAELLVWDTTAADWAIATGTTAVDNDQWQHVAARFNGTEVTVFVNGSAEATSDTVQTNAFFANNVLIGIRGQALNLPFDGLIDDVRIYNRALTNAEIASIADSNG